MPNSRGTMKNYAIIGLRLLGCSVGLLVALTGILCLLPPLYDLLSVWFPDIVVPVRGGDFWCEIHMSWTERIIGWAVGLVIFTAGLAVVAWALPRKSVGPHRDQLSRRGVEIRRAARGVSLFQFYLVIGVLVVLSVELAFRQDLLAHFMPIVLVILVIGAASFGLARNRKMLGTAIVFNAVAAGLCLLKTLVAVTGTLSTRYYCFDNMDFLITIILVACLVNTTLQIIAAEDPDMTAHEAILPANE